MNVKKGFTVVNGGINTALLQAKSIAKEKDVLIMGGANVAQQFFAADLFDEVHIHIALILLGNGTRLFEKENDRLIEFTKIKLVETAAATHLFLKPANK